ncbi:CHRD domain-containing protein [Spirosoma luteum]|uniref:CHRD domain-containing protein n=1 Tax=Spirosoma luteum TaxID=431553 RepID=UPI000367F7F7|nr:CHRD domain-containing protein [Spirosoma luteum]
MKKSRLLSVAALLALGLIGSSCSKEDNPATLSTTNVAVLTATINGANEKPASTTSTAVGSFVGNLNTDTRVLSYTVTYSGITPVAGHLHRINAANLTGPVDIPFPSLTSPITGTTAALAQSKVDSMLNGFYYANLHTTAYPAGEIRGDIKKR